MSSDDKDTIYIDIDEEITGIIDKLKGSNAKVVALVLPKRAAVFQSIVNMKLLKRAADSVKKNPVLITTEAGLLPLAGMAGIHVAKTLTSKPEIPAAPQGLDDSEETVQEDGNTADLPLDPNQPIGQLAGAAAAADGMETLVLDDEELPPEAALPTEGAKTFEPPAKIKKNKKLAVPNFERFRLWLILGALLLLITIGALIFATISLPKATITIKTNATKVDTNLNLKLSTTATALSSGENTVPAKLATQQKTYSQQVPTTGQKNTGNKASGSVTVTNCDNSDVTIPAGSGFSSGGNTYISQQAVTVPDSNFTSPGSGSKCKNDGKASVDVTAQNGGTAYNLPAGANFTIAGFSHLSGQGGSISGGTDNIVQSVNQNDITSAKSKISATDSDVKQTLIDQLKKDHYYPIEVTYVAGTPTVTTSANVGEVATTVTVTETAGFTMLGAHRDDLKSLIDTNMQTQIDTSKQIILDDGLDKANFSAENISPTGAQITMSTSGTAGPDLHIDSIKQQAAGKRIGAIKAQLQSNPDVTNVDVKLSPFWVSTVPKKTERIIVNIAKPTASVKANSSNGSKP